MNFFTGIYKAFTDQVARAEAEERAMRKNPALAQTPEVKRRYRKHGLLLCVVGAGVAFIAYKVFLSTGTVYIAAPAMSTVLIGSGMVMVITGKNPFTRFIKD